MGIARDGLRGLLDALVESIETGGTGEEVAARVHVSRFHFDRIVRAALDETPGAFRRRLLLERAAYSLAGGASVGEAALEAIDRQTRELKEAHEQQAATSEVLEIIGHSTFDLQRVLESLLEKAVRLCGADRGFIFTQDEDVYRFAANYGHSAEFVEKIVKRYPVTQDRGSASGRAILERRVVHIHDVLAVSRKTAKTRGRKATPSSASISARSGHFVRTSIGRRVKA